MLDSDKKGFLVKFSYSTSLSIASNPSADRVCSMMFDFLVIYLRVMVLVNSFVSHSDDIIQIAWSPYEETVFASASADRRINIWDAGIVGAEQDSEDNEDPSSRIDVCSRWTYLSNH